MSALAWAAGGLLVATESGLYRAVGELVAPLEGPVLGLTAWPGAELWCARASGLACSRDGGVTWQPGPQAPAPPPQQREVTSLRALAAGPDGRLCIVIHTSWLAFYPESAGPTPLLHAAGMMRDHAWVFEGGAWSPALESGPLHGACFDREGRAWVAGDGGLWRFADGAWHHVVSRPAIAVAVDPRGRVVLATTRAAFLSTDGKTFAAMGTSYREKGPWGSLEGNAEELTTLVLAPDGAVWAASASASSGGVFRLAGKGAHWESHNFGLLNIPGVGSREGDVRVTALAFGPDAAFAGTASHGLFQRTRTSVPQ